ncbi:alpha-amylase family glycosyl hydrolase [Candidatus Harpocratesius sp.]
MNYFPRIIEINTWPWLLQLKNENKINTIADIPELIWKKELKHFDYVWLMGIWKRSKIGKEIAQNHEGLQLEYKKALSDYNNDDIIGSPYAVAAYTIDPYFGDESDFINLSNQLHEQGKKLVVDFIPNHVALDHEWIKLHPDYFIRGTSEDLKFHPKDFFQIDDQIRKNNNLTSNNSEIFAHGKDPFFPSWTDTAQLNAFSSEYRQEVIRTLERMAKWVDGVRCDMAMLLTNRIFHQTWKERAGPPLNREFWDEIISNIRKKHPNFLFIAEVYWDMEWQLQQLGFDFCYDKRLFDRLIHASTEDIRAHLTASWDYQRKLLRFIENHDELRANYTLKQERSKAAAVLTYTLPGAYLHHYGQQFGWKFKLPVQLARYPVEMKNNEIYQFYTSLYSNQFLKYQAQSNKLNWILLKKLPESIIAYIWQLVDDLEIILINYSPSTQILDKFIIKTRNNDELSKRSDSINWKWYSLTNTKRMGQFSNQNSKNNPILEVLPWEALRILKE